MAFVMIYPVLSHFDFVAKFTVTNLNKDFTNTVRGGHSFVKRYFFPLMMASLRQCRRCGQCYENKKTQLPPGFPIYQDSLQNIDKILTQKSDYFMFKLFFEIKERSFKSFLVKKSNSQLGDEWIGSKREQPDNWCH